MKKILLLVAGGIFVGVIIFFILTKNITTPIPNVTPVSQVTPPTPAQEVSKNGIIFSLDAVSEASFRIDEILRRSPFTAIGTTHDVKGDIVIDFSDPSRSKVDTITVDARTLHTDDRYRDEAIQYILHSNKAGNEYVSFTPKTITGLPAAFAAGIPLNLFIAGDLTISGVTHVVTFTASNVVVSPDSITGDARAAIKRSDYGLVIPNIPFVANVSDDVSIALQLNAKLKR